MNASSRWSIEKANEWYARQPWLTGCNFIPSTAINQLEMWQAETFDPTAIDRELGLAAALGFNTVRTFLHDLLWEADPQGFKQRIDCFLEIASRHGIRPMLVFFDDCWNRNASLGLQPVPRPGIHNSGWVQSPGQDVVNADPCTWGRLERYVKDILTTFAGDERILLWDLYNEPGNSSNGDKSLPLLRAVFEWARAVDPSQPLTAGIWFDNKELNKFQLAASDIITFHNYQTADRLEKEIAELELYGRPVICTEWMARTTGSLVGTHLPVFASHKVGCINWGLVSGKTNTIFAWQDLDNPMARIDLSSSDECGEPKVWFHDLFRLDGTPYDPDEVEAFKKWAKQRTPASSLIMTEMA
jgi:hypothetical protein